MNMYQFPCRLTNIENFKKSSEGCEGMFDSPKQMTEFALLILKPKQQYGSVLQSSVVKFKSWTILNLSSECSFFHASSALLPPLCCWWRGPPQWHGSWQTRQKCNGMWKGRKGGKAHGPISKLCTCTGCTASKCVASTKLLYIIDLPGKIGTASGHWFWLQKPLQLPHLRWAALYK